MIVQGKRARTPDSTIQPELLTDAPLAPPSNSEDKDEASASPRASAGGATTPSNISPPLEPSPGFITNQGAKQNPAQNPHLDSPAAASSGDDTAAKIGYRVVSPLNQRMSKMVIKSKSIAQRQKRLIAERNNGAQGADDIERQEVSFHEMPESTTISNGNDDDDELTIPSPKKLKRDKLPSPLNVSAVSGTQAAVPNPLIKSAPARNSRQMYRAQGRPYMHRVLPIYHQQQQQQQQFIQQPYYYYSPYMQPHYPPQTMAPFSYRVPVTAIPYPAPVHPTFGQAPILPLPPSAARGGGIGGGGGGGARVHFQNESGGYTTPASQATTSTTASGNSSSSSSRGLRVRNNPVMDVYPSGEMREAPIVAQPVSARREKFVAKERDSSGANVEVSHEDEEKEDSDGVESIAIEDDPAGTDSNGVIDLQGEIRLNEDIFYYNLASIVARSDADKEKFMKVCSTAYDEFVKML